MAAGKILLQKASGGVTTITGVDGTGATELQIPESGVLAITDSPTFTGNVTGLGVATGTSFNSITGLSSTLPVVNGVATIGTSTTVAKADHIHPSDTTKVTKVTSTDNAVVRFNGTTGEVQNSSVVIDDNGNVGIDDGAPQYKLSIGQSISLPSTAGSKITAFSKYTNVGNGSFLRFDTVRISAGSTHNSSEERIRKVVDVTEMGYIGFGDNNVKLGNGSGDKVIIDGNGNVGIGTSVINNKLEVNGSIGFGSTTGNGRIYTDANWGCLLQSDVSSPAVAEFGFLNTAGAALAWIDTAGNLLLKSGNGGLGYGTGAGGTVTQLTSKSTAVTLNKPSGTIITSNSALSAGATVSFAVNNSLISAIDTIIINCNIGNYRVVAFSHQGQGTFTVSITNITGVLLSETLYIDFAIIKGANS